MRATFSVFSNELAHFWRVFGKASPKKAWAICEVILLQKTSSRGEREGEKDRLSEMRERFKEAASRTILPVFMVREGNGWRPVNYEVDIAPRIPWEEVNLDPVKSLTLSHV